jgi:hypothetical protein
MANNLMTFENVVENIVPKVTIQRIILETSATDAPSDPKNPHASPVDVDGSIKLAFTKPAFSIDDNPDLLKVNLILSLKGFGSKNLKRDNVLSNIFDNADLMSMVRSRIYQIDDIKSLELARQKSAVAITMPADDSTVTSQVGGGLILATGGLTPGDATINYSLDNISTIELYNIISGSPEFFESREINLSEELNSYSQGELIKFQTTDAAGSISYNFPFRIDPFLLSKNSKLLAYMVVTEIDSDLLLDRVKATIGGSSDYELPTEVEEYIKEYNNDINNKTISFDFVINDGSVNQTAALLKRDDNEEFWFGPYHEMPDGTLMTGNSHNDMTVAPKNRNVILEPVLLANTKIVDLRDDEEIEKVFLEEVYKIESLYDEVIKKSTQAKKSDKNTLEEMPEMFSTSYKSVGSNGDCSYLFGIDKLKILKYKSLLPGIAQNLIKSYADEGVSFFVQKVVQDILDATSIQYLNIYRKRIKINQFGSNKLGTQNPSQESFKHNILNADIDNSYEDSKLVKIAETGPKVIVPTVKKVEALNFLQGPTGESRIHFYSFKDNFLDPENSKLTFLKTGNYEYSYELVLEDGITKVLTSRLASMINLQSEIKSYLNFINENIVNCYDGSVDQFNVDFINNSKYSTVPANFQLIADQMIQILVMLNAAADLETYGTFGSNIVKIAHPASGNFQGLLKFIKIADTFIEKIQKLPGIKTGLEKYLDLAVTGLQSDSVQLPDTIKINETFPDHASLDDYATGYDYLVPTKDLNNFLKAPSVNSLRTIPFEVYQGIFMDQIRENFIIDNDNISYGNPSDPNVSRYFNPAKVFISQKGYQTKSFPQNFLKPYTQNFNYYKPIMIDIIEYFLSKYSQGKYVEQPTNINNIRRLFNIAKYFGIAIGDDWLEVSPHLADSAAKQYSSNEYYDSATNTNLQNQSTENKNLSGINFGGVDETSLDQDYLDGASLVTEVQNIPNLENMLLGLLSNVILPNESPISLIATNEVLPQQLQALFAQTMVGGPETKKYLNGLFTTPFSTLTNTNTSLLTFGWWWLNYGNIADVHYINSYQSSGLSSPNWAPLTLDDLAATVASGKRIICKIFKYENSLRGVRNDKLFLDLPILDEYFIIEPANGVEIKSSQQEQQLFTIDEDPDADLKKSANKPLEIVYNNFGKDLNSVLNTDRRVIRNVNTRRFETKDLKSSQRPSSRSTQRSVNRRDNNRILPRTQSRQDTTRVTDSDRGSNY